MLRLTSIVLEVLCYVKVVLDKDDVVTLMLPRQKEIHGELRSLYLTAT